MFESEATWLAVTKVLWFLNKNINKKISVTFVGDCTFQKTNREANISKIPNATNQLGKTRD